MITYTISFYGAYCANFFLRFKYGLLVQFVSTELTVQTFLGGFVNHGYLYNLYVQSLLCKKFRGGFKSWLLVQFVCRELTVQKKLRGLNCGYLYNLCLRSLLCKKLGI